MREISQFFESGDAGVMTQDRAKNDAERATSSDV
jgi:hypothetical protein